MFWLEPIWLGTAAGSGDGGRRILDTEELMEPMFTTVQRVLSNELDDDIVVWPELVQADIGEHDKNVVVRNVGAEDIQTTSSRQQSKRHIEIHCYASDANEAERMMRDVRIVMKRSDLIAVSTMTELPGGYNEKGDFFIRAMLFTIRTRL